MFNLGIYDARLRRDGIWVVWLEPTGRDPVGPVVINDENAPCPNVIGTWNKEVK